MTLGITGTVAVAGLTIVALLFLPRVSRACGSLVRRLRSSVPRRRRSTVATVLLLVSASLFFGAYQCIDVGQPFAYFNSLSLTPKVLEVWVTRGFGSQLAGLSVTLVSLVTLDETAHAGFPDRASSFGRRAVIAAAATFVAYVPACALIFAGALTAWKVWFGQDTRSFFTSLWEAFAWDDPLWGFGRSAIYGVILAGVLFGGRRLWLSTTRSLGVKLAWGGAALIATSLAECGIRLATT